MALRASSTLWFAIRFGLITFLILLGVGVLLTQDASLFCLRWGETDVPQCWHPQNIQIVAMMWIVATFYGILDTLRTFRETASERAAAGSDPVLIGIASGNMRRELFRMVELASLLVVGVLAVSGTVATIPSRLLVLLVIILLVVNAHLDRRERQRTEQLIRNGKNGGTNH